MDRSSDAPIEEGARSGDDAGAIVEQCVSDATQAISEMRIDAGSSNRLKGGGTRGTMVRVRSMNDVQGLEESGESLLLHGEDSGNHGNEETMTTTMTRLLWDKIRSLSTMEKESQERAERQRIELLVQKVEDEVVYEGILDEMCMKVRADDEAMEIERREREWEIERREVRLEEEVMNLKAKIRRLEDELRVSQVEKNYLLHRKQDDMDEVVQRIVRELKEDESVRLDGECSRDIRAIIAAEDERTNEIPSREILAAFQDLFREADERHEREKSALENALRVKGDAEEGLRREKQKLCVREKQMECQVVALEKEAARLVSLLREKEAAVLAEKERRGAVQEEAEKLAVMLRDERSGHRVAIAKLKKLEAGTNKVKEKVVREQAEMNLKDLEKDLARLCLIFSQKKEVPRTEVEEIEGLRRQRDAAVADRDALEEKLNLLLKRSRDRESEMDAMWLEREKVLIVKVAALEEQVEQWQTKCRRVESEMKMRDRTSVSEEIRGLEGMIRERDARLKEAEERLETKEFELQTVKTVQRKLVDSLAQSKKQLDEMKDRRGEECEDDSCCIDVESVATEMTMELKRFYEEIRVKEEGLEKERRELELGQERLYLERAELEQKMSETLGLMDELKKEVEQMEAEKKQMEAAIASKTALADALRKKLLEKESEMKVRVERLQAELQMVEEEMDKEKERKEMMEVFKRKLSTEVKIKEEVWMKDMEQTTHELTSLRAELKRRKEELKVYESEEARLKLENGEIRAKLRRVEEVTSANSLRASVEERRNVEWQSALAKVAVFDRQITEAMQAIQTLREELSAKEAELLRARTEPDAEWERREEAFLVEKAELLKVLEAERAEAAELRRKVAEKTKRKHAEEELRARVDDLERKTKSSMFEVEEALHAEKEMFLSPERRKRLVLAEERSETSSSRASKSLDCGSVAKSNRLSENGLWNIDGPLRFPAEDKLAPHEEHRPEHLSLSLPSRNQKWVVDSTWMENVRKEHTLLVQQLVLERQRVAALGQVEADNRCLEAMMVRAMDQKKQCEMKLAQLQDARPFRSWSTTDVLPQISGKRH